MRLRRRADLTCRAAVEMITSYLDDELPIVARRTLEHHLSRCPNCAEYLVQLRATISAAGRIDADRLDPKTRQALVSLYRKTMS